MVQYVQMDNSIESYREVAWQYANNTIDLLLGLLNSCNSALRPVLTIP